MAEGTCRQTAATFLSSKGITTYSSSSDPLLLSSPTKEYTQEAGWEFLANTNDMWFMAKREDHLENIWSTLYAFSRGLAEPARSRDCIPEDFVQLSAQSDGIDIWYKRKAGALQRHLRKFRAIPATDYARYLCGEAPYEPQLGLDVVPNISGLPDNVSPDILITERQIWRSFFSANGTATGLEALLSCNVSPESLRVKLAGIAVHCCMNSEEYPVAMMACVAHSEPLTPFLLSVPPDLCIQRPLETSDLLHKQDVRRQESLYPKIITFVSISHHGTCSEGLERRLASYVHASLNMVILHLYETMQFEAKIASGVCPKLPSWAFIMGLVYTSETIRFYAHFPTYNVNPGPGCTREAHWTYRSAYLNALPLGQVEEVHTVSALLRVRRHASRLAKEMRNFIVPEVLL